MHRSRHHWLFTVAAVFLLLFTAVDLAYPQMCGEDGDDDSTVLSASSATETSIGGASTPAPAPVPAHVDDCFCCCGHVIAGAVFHVAAPTVITESKFDLTAHRVIATPRAAFHPPRIA